MFNNLRQTSQLKIQTCSFCLLEVRAMVVAAQQPLAECTAIFALCIVETPPPLEDTW